MTAAHVVQIEVPQCCGIVGMFVDPHNEWRAWNRYVVDVHPTEDVALLKMGGEHWQESTIRVSFEKQFSSAAYYLLGYPAANLLEDVGIKDETGRVLGRPDLIYSEGHIRRRVGFSVPGIRGRCLYELSQPVGAGCSGSPIFRVLRGHLEVIGIYVADKIETIPFKTYDRAGDEELQTIEIRGALAHAARMDGLTNWIPAGLGTTINEIS